MVGFVVFYYFYGYVKGIEYTPTTTGDMGQKRIDVYFTKGDNLYNVWMTSTDYDVDISGFNMIIDTIKPNNLFFSFFQQVFIFHNISCYCYPNQIGFTNINPIPLIHIF